MSEEELVALLNHIDLKIQLALARMNDEHFALDRLDGAVDKDRQELINRIAFGESS